MKAVLNQLPRQRKHNMDNTDTLIKEHLSKLPKSLLRAIDSVPWQIELEKIARNLALGSDKFDVLERETMLVLYEFENPLDYAANLQRELGVSEDTALEISLEVLTSVFSKINSFVEKFESEPAVEKKATPEPEKLVEINSDLPVVAEEHVPLVVEKKPEPPVNLPTAQAIPKVEAVPPKVSIPEIRTWKTDIAPARQEEKKPEPQKVQSTLTPVNHYPQGRDPYREPVNDDEQ
jgi:hypothetical protein